MKIIAPFDRVNELKPQEKMDNRKPFLNIGVIAHNEQKNIKLLLDELLSQAEYINFPFNITVVASGCTDMTEDIVKTYENRDSRIKLLTEKQRKGKASAINLFLGQTHGDFLIISSADIIPANNTLGKFLNAFSDSYIGMVGGRSMPQPSPGIIASFNNLLWELHHEIAIQRPKLGEIVALRRIIHRIPEGTIADEAALEAIITQSGLKLKYLPEVIIYNYGPKSLTSFIKQRIRNFLGHLYVKKKMSYKVSTYSIIPLISLIIKKIRLERKKTLAILFLVSLEIYARAVAFYYFFIRNKTYSIWHR